MGWNCLVLLVPRLLQRERRTEKRSDRQTIKRRLLEPLMLHEYLERPAHAVWLQKMDRRTELRALRFQLRDQVLDAESHEKTHLIGKAGDREAGVLSRCGEARKVHMGGHVLQADTLKRIVRSHLVVVAQEGSAWTIRTIQVLGGMAIVNRQDDPAMQRLCHLRHPL